MPVPESFIKDIMKRYKVTRKQAKDIYYKIENKRKKHGGKKK